VVQSEYGLWRVAVTAGQADLLLAALDPDLPFVVIETWDGDPGWHEATVRVGATGELRTRTVRRNSFDLLLSPKEAVEIGQYLRVQGVSGGGLTCYQFRARPRSDFRLPAQPKARSDAMRGLGVELLIDLPHHGEVAVVSSPARSALDAFVARLP
jgi:hypothetical protein